MEEIGKGQIVKKQSCFFTKKVKELPKKPEPQKGILALKRLSPASFENILSSIKPVFLFSFVTVCHILKW